MAASEKIASKPFVSVIMPVRNEERFIRRSLTAILDQTYPNELTEIIIADGMSTDGTREVIQRLASDVDRRIVIIDNPQRIAPTGLNCAIEQASGEIIIRVDGHCEIAPDYLENCVTILRSGKADGVGGPIETIGETYCSRAIAIAMSSKFGVGGSAFRTINDREMYTDTVAFPGYTREIIEKAGPFNEELVRNQDDEYNFRIRKLGGRILLSPLIRSRYASRSSLKALGRQYFQYGYWKVRVLQMHPRQMSLRQFVPFAFVLSLALLVVLSFISVYGFWILIGIVSMYIFANLFAVAVVTDSTNRRLAAYLSLAYPVIHLSYGAGFFLGLIAFASRWRSKK